MKRTVILLAMTLALSGCDDDDNGPNGPSNTGPIVFTAQLSAANEVPPVTNSESGATGTVTITFNVPRDAASGNVTGGGSATFAIQLNGFPANSSAILAHIHNAPAGQNAGVFVNTGLSAAAPIAMPNGSATNTITINNLSQDQATQVTANPAGFYFNVHTPVNTGGAVRGQLVRQQQ
jgi:hypothetical protein